MKTETEKLLTPKQAAEYLNVHYRTIQNWIYSGRLPFSKIGTRIIRIRQSDINALVGGEVVGGKN
jgi:excisionase family DNA binding protein